MSAKSNKYKSWREKLENPVPGLPKVVDVPAKWQKQMGGKKILVPTPMLVDERIRKVPNKKLITTGQIRKDLAKQFKADSTCPMTLGIFLRISSETAEEDRCMGKKRITPYWRVIKDDGSLNPKFPGGVKAQAQKLKKEGHKIAVGKSKTKLKVKDFDKAL
ncbi:MAG: MGMT family protein [Sedimentisphaerales bacterium]|nr:MGMT family protein [Sedimentisphaerales bacterium]